MFCQVGTKKFIADKISSIRKLVNKDRVLVGVSGGVDSSVVAALLYKAIGDRMCAVLIDHGLMRKKKRRNVNNSFMMA